MMEESKSVGRLRASANAEHATQPLLDGSAAAPSYASANQSAIVEASGSKAKMLNAAARLREMSTHSRVLWATLLICMVIAGVIFTLEKMCFFLPAVPNTPAHDPRVFSHMTLANGLPVMLIHNPGASSAAFAASVTAGAFYDPKALPGLAHFNEHMLFLGNEDYPGASEFDTFMAQHGGSNNAATASEWTTYYAKLDPNSLSEGMQRFAAFFRKPLFNPKFVNQEVHAVNSEHEKNLASTSRRMNRVLDSLAADGSVVRKFATGSLKSLLIRPKEQGLDTVAELHKYFNANYCPMRMHLVVSGRQPIHELGALARNTFGALDSRNQGCNVEKAVMDKPTAFPEGSSQVGNLVRLQSLDMKDRPQMWMVFHMTSLDAMYKSTPDKYIEFFLNDVGHGSLRSTLVKAGLVTDVGAGFSSNSAEGRLVLVSQLTPKGMEDQGKGVQDACVAYLAHVKQWGVDPVIYKALQDYSQVAYDWQSVSPSAMDEVFDLATRMGDYPIEDVMQAQKLVVAPSAEAIQKVLGSISVSRMNVLLQAPWAKGAEPKAVHTEEYYAARYGMEKLDKTDLSKWDSWLNGGQLPASTGSLPLSFLKPTALQPPTNLALRSDLSVSSSVRSARPYVAPVAVALASSTSSYYQPSTLFPSPTTIVSVSVLEDKELSSKMTPKDLVGSTMLASAINDFMLEDVTSLLKSGLSGGVSRGLTGWSLEFSGYPEKLPVLVDRYLQVLAKPEAYLQEARFQQMVEEERLSLQDVSGRSQIGIASEKMRLVQSFGTVSRDQHLQALQEIGRCGLKCVSALAREQLQKVTVKTVVSGNMDKTAAEKLDTKLQQLSLSGQHLLSSQVMSEAPVANLAAPVEVRVRSDRLKDPNHVTMLSYQMPGRLGLLERACISLVSDIASSTVYDNLRTDQQLGYVVQGSFQVKANTGLFLTLVQGSKVAPDEAEARAEKVLLETIPAKLAAMPQQEFDTRKEHLMTSLSSPPGSAGEELGSFEREVLAQTPCPGRKAMMRELLQSPLMASPQVLLSFWHRLMGSEGAKNRMKVVVKVFAATATDAEVAGPRKASLAAKGEAASTVALHLQAVASNLLQQERTDTIALFEQDTSNPAPKADSYWRHEPAVCESSLADVKDIAYNTPAAGAPVSMQQLRGEKVGEKADKGVSLVQISASGQSVHEGSYHSSSHESRHVSLSHISHHSPSQRGKDHGDWGGIRGYADCKQGGSRPYYCQHAGSRSVAPPECRASGRSSYYCQDASAPSPHPAMPLL